MKEKLISIDIVLEYLQNNMEETEFYDPYTQTSIKGIESCGITFEKIKQDLINLANSQ
jgi:hypothetical protein